MTRAELIDILIEKEGLLRDQIEIVITEREKTGAPFGYLLIKFGLISAEKWYDFVLKELKIVPVKISEIDIQRDVITAIPEFTCKRYRTIPIFKGGGKIVCGMVDPTDTDAIAELKKITSKEIEPRLVRDTEVRQAIDKYLVQGSMDAIKPFQQVHGTGKIFQPSDSKDLSDSSAVSAVEDIVIKAVEVKATDIHIEIEEDGVRLRYRINGLLYEFPPPPLEIYSAMISHIKVLCDLDIAIKRIPQDGYFKMKKGSHDIDLRISTYPTIFGEMVAMRVLDKANIVSGLDHVGFLPEILHRWRILLDEPYGIILVTGPTGSGKTTTLYSSISELDCVRNKVMTIEDPVEYHLDNVDQTQINPKAGLTFAVALRSILRQDPDIVMVGEVRDLETAEISFRAAQTGQLVFSTLHTNTAPGANIRLIDMGVESYLISSSLLGVLNQRLVRSICHGCKEQYQPLEEEVKELSPGIVSGEHKFFRGKGCNLCNGTGFGGRIGIFELLVMNEELRRANVRKEDISVIKEIAMRSGMKTLREDGITKVLQGHTTINEVIYSTRKEQE